MAPERKMSQPRGHRHIFNLTTHRGSGAWGRLEVSW